MKQTCLYVLFSRVVEMETLLVSVCQLRNSGLTGALTVLTEIYSWFSLVIPPGSLHISVSLFTLTLLLNAT
jgi:hypothetical protein